MDQEPRAPERPPSTSEVRLPTVQVPPGLLAGQVALVTGAATGIGRATALAMAQSGADIVIVYRSSRDEAETLLAAVRALGRKAVMIAADMANEEEVVAMFKQAVADMGTVDIMVANAGMEKDGMIEQMALADWEKVIAVNLTGAFLCAREALREFRRRGARPVSSALGKIIFTSSVHDVIPWAGHSNYVASKGGLLMFMKSLAQEVAADHVRVNAISPGAIRTPINRDAWGTEEAYRALLTKIPYGRIGEPADVARAAVWLASDQADYITGTTLYVDGGMTLYPSFMDGG